MKWFDDVVGGGQPKNRDGDQAEPEHDSGKRDC